jgi:hypothetical protein
MGRLLLECATEEAGGRDCLGCKAASHCCMLRIGRILEKYDRVVQQKKTTVVESNNHRVSRVWTSCLCAHRLFLIVIL